MEQKPLTILWDFDGTLFDTYPVYASMFSAVLDNQSVTEAEIYEQLKVSFSHAYSYYHLTEVQIQAFFQLEKRAAPDVFKPFEGVEAILRSTQKNVIMTHKPRKEVHAILDYYGWCPLFQEMVAGDDGFARKPDPASYEYLHQKHHIGLVVGDRELDIIPAKKLGIATCLFQNKESKLADYSLDHYRDFWREMVQNA